MNVYDGDVGWFDSGWADVGEARTISFEFLLEDMHLDTKRLLIGFDVENHACEVKAETGDCQHWWS